jgi:DNA polymerase-1
VRKAFVAPEGQLLLCADYSQIELRVLAHLSRDPVLLETYAKDEDVHVRTASLVFDVPIASVTPDQRRAAKTINFGVIYGMGEAALARQIDVKRDVAARFIESYFKRYEGVARFMQQTVEAARRGEAVRTLLGRRRFLPNLKNANRALRAEAERVAKNTPIQGTAADILKVAMVRLGAMGQGGEVVPGARMVLTVHDELVFEVPASGIEEAKGRVREVMSGAMKLDVPLVVDVGAGENWAQAK